MTNEEFLHYCEAKASHDVSPEFTRAQLLHLAYLAKVAWAVYLDLKELDDNFMHSMDHAVILTWVDNAWGALKDSWNLSPPTYDPAADIIKHSSPSAEVLTVRGAGFSYD